MRTNFMINLLVLLLITLSFIPDAYSDWTLSKDSINFGDVPVGSTKSEAVVITNNGAVPLDLKFYTSIPELTTETVGNIPVAPGGSVTLVIKFSPTLRGNYSEEVLVASDDPNRPSRKITITAVSSYSSGIDVSPRSINFGSVDVGSSKTETLRIGNNGGSELNVQISTAAGTPFTVSESNFKLRPGEIKTLSVTFSPTQKGSFSSSITIVSDDRLTPKVVVSLYGDTGAEFPLIFYPPLINFGTILVNSVSEKLLRLENTSQYITDVTLTISNIVGSAFSFSSGTSIRFTMVPGERKQIPVLFSPQNKGDYSAVLYISTGSNVARLSLVGEASETTATTGLEPQNPPPSSGSGGGGGCSVAGKVENSNFGSALLMFAPAVAIALRRFWRRFRK